MGKPLGMMVEERLQTVEISEGGIDAECGPKLGCGGARLKWEGP